MNLPSEGELLRVFISENDRHHGRPLYEVIVEEARSRGLAGATVLRGTEGFGASSRIHTAKILRLSEDLPMVIEIVDKPERIAEFLPNLDAMVGEGLITLERVRILAYRHRKP
jgi:PII-like signaling protein